MPKGRPGVKIFCINDGTYYESLADAANHYHIASSSISKQIKGERATAGGLHFIKINNEMTPEELRIIREKALERFYKIK